MVVCVAAFNLLLLLSLPLILAGTKSQQRTTEALSVTIYVVECEIGNPDQLIIAGQHMSQ